MNVKEESPSLHQVQTLFLAQSEKFIQNCTDQMDLARARGDQQGIIREQIKAEVMKAAQHMLESALMQDRKAQP